MQPQKLVQDAASTLAASRRRAARGQDRERKRQEALDRGLDPRNSDAMADLVHQLEHTTDPSRIRQISGQMQEQGRAAVQAANKKFGKKVFFGVVNLDQMRGRGESAARGEVQTLQKDALEKNQEIFNAPGNVRPGQETDKSKLTKEQNDAVQTSARIGKKLIKLNDALIEGNDGVARKELDDIERISRGVDSRHARVVETAKQDTSRVESEVSETTSRVSASSQTGEVSHMRDAFAEIAQGKRIDSEKTVEPRIEGVVGVPVEEEARGIPQETELKAVGQKFRDSVQLAQTAADQTVQGQRETAAEAATMMDETKRDLGTYRDTLLSVRERDTQRQNEVYNFVSQGGVGKIAGAPKNVSWNDFTQVAVRTVIQQGNNTDPTTLNIEARKLMSDFAREAEAISKGEKSINDCPTAKTMVAGLRRYMQTKGLMMDAPVEGGELGLRAA